MNRKYLNYTDNDIIENSKNVTSMAQLLKSLDLKVAGGNYANMYRKLQKLNVNTDHWTGQGWTKDKQLKDWSEYTQGSSLKKHLIKLRGHKCEICTLSKWRGRKIKLELHHIDADRTNNDANNLQLLCPNCHSLTKSWKKQKHLL